ncbi:MAG: HAMP domain-containing sensor histidine kinase [Solirubrobacteraceae bacterium]
MIRMRLGGPLLALLAALLGSLVCLLVYGREAGATCLSILAPVGLLTVVIVDGFLARRARFGGMRRQLSIGAVIVVGQLLLAAGLFAVLMSHSAQDALFTAVLALYAGLLGAWAARAIARRVIADIDELRRGLAAIEGGARADLAMSLRGGDELALLAQDIERLAALLGGEEAARARVEKSRSDLLAAVSHDLRTPLTSLRLLSDALEDDLVDGALRREYVSRMGTHVRSLSALIDDLFELSRLEAGDLRWSMGRVGLDDLLLETVAAMRGQAEAGAVSVRAECSGELQVARADPERLQRVLFNLIQNAIRHTPADGSITVRAAPAGDESVQVEVSDTGPGIPRRERERVFDAFVQGDESRRSGGAGLGLAISRAIVEAHGGRIWVADVGGGASVRFSLPTGTAGSRIAVGASPAPAR